MYGFIRRPSKFRVSLSLIVLTLSMRQTGGGTDVGSSNTQLDGASGDPESFYSEAPALALAQSIDQELSGSERHAYTITLHSGQYLRVLITQSDIEVGMALYAPDGQKLSEFICREKGPTPLSTIAKVSGAYRLEVCSLEKDATQGRYEVRLDEIRPATALDIHRIAAEKALANAEELRREWNAESNRKAIKCYEEALRRGRTAGEPLQEATSLRNIGEIHHLLGEQHTALNIYQQALILSKKANDPRGEIETLIGIADVFLHLGENQKAMENCGRALSLSRSNDDRLGEAQALNCTGKVHYAAFGDLRKSLEYYDQALGRWASLSNRRGQAEALLYFGYIHSDLGEAQKATVSFNRALSLWRSLDDRRGEALTLMAIGHMHSRLGEKQEGLDLLNRALELVRPTGDKVWEAAILGKLGWALYEMGEKQRSLDYYRDGLRLFQAVNKRLGEAAFLAEMGEIYYSSGQSQRALDHYSRALSLSRSLGDRQIESYVLRNMGVVCESLGQKAEAVKYYKQALSLNRACGDRREEAYTLNNLGHVYETLGRFPESVDHYDRALLLSRATQDRAGEALALYNTSRAERGQGNLNEARSQLEEALKIVESLRAKVGSQELRSSYFASEHHRYDFYIDLLMQMNRRRPSEELIADALHASERARARSFLESLRETRADIRQGVDLGLLERERSLQQSLQIKADRQMQLLSGKANQAEAAGLAKEIQDLTGQYEDVRGQIRANSPRYAALTQPQPLNLKEIQERVVDDDSLLLEYALGDEHSYLWAVTQTTIKSYELPKREEIEKAARGVYGLLIARQPKAGKTGKQHQVRVSEADAQYWPQAAALSQTLLGPVADQLGTKRLLIVTEGALQYLPFGALPTPGTRDAGTRGRGNTGSLLDAETRRGGDPAVPLIVEHEIVSLPSASALAVLRHEMRDRQAASKVVVVLADPVFEADDPRVMQGTGANGDMWKKPRRLAESPRPVTELHLALRDVGILREGGLSVPRLLSSRQEAEAIIAVVPAGAGMKATDFKASRATAASPELGQYRIVHFATHGLLNSEHPGLSGLVLSLVDEQGKPQDGFLRLHDIYNLNLPVDLVVLSACNTGLGKEVRGEGLVGIVRGFMYAGAARVVASLWKVDDQATAELMKRFYERMLQGGLTPAAALRAAQVEMWQQKRWRTPYYWAAFVLQGEWK